MQASARRKRREGAGAPAFSHTAGVGLQPSRRAPAPPPPPWLWPLLHPGLSPAWVTDTERPMLGSQSQLTDELDDA